MSASLGILVIHGMGSQEPDFSAPMEREIRDRLGALESRVAWQSVHWADVLKEREDALWARMRSAREPDGRRIRLDFSRAREFVVHNFGDALAYGRDREQPDSAYRAIHQVVDRGVRALKDGLDEGAPVLVLAHSLGGHIVSNYVWDRQREAARGEAHAFEPIPTLTSIVTFGCNIALFSLSLSTAVPILLPDPAVTKPALVETARWLNFLDRDDVLGWPLRPLYAASRAGLEPERAATIDRMYEFEVDAGSALTSWSPLSHAGYWTDDDLTVPVADHVRALLAAVDA